MLNNTCILVRLHIGMPPQTKRASGASEDVEARYRTAPKQARVNKSLFSKKDIGHLQQIANRARTTFNEISLPYDVGSRIIPSKSYFDFVQTMSGLSTEFDTAKHRFLNDYHISLMRAESELGDLFDSDDYPNSTMLQEVINFSIESDVIPAVTAFDDLVGLTDEEVEKLKASAVEGQQAKVDEALKDLFKRLHKSLSKAAARLAVEDSSFKNTLVGNIEAALDAVDTLNITGNQELIDMAEEIREMVEGVSPDSLRVDKDLRAKTAADAKDLVNKVSEFF